MKANPMNHRIFISHSTKDKATAIQILQHLKSLGYPTESLFLDSDEESGIPIGTNWESELYEKVDSCVCMIVLCSKNWQASKWCFAEALIAKHRGVPLIPLLLEQDVDLSLLNQFQAIRDYIGSDDDLLKVSKALVMSGLPPEIASWKLPESPAIANKEESVREVKATIQNKFENSKIVVVSGNVGSVTQTDGIDTKWFAIIALAIVAGVLCIIFIPKLVKQLLDEDAQKTAAAASPDVMLETIVLGKSESEIEREARQLDKSSKRIGLKAELSAELLEQAKAGGPIEFNASGFEVRAYFLEEKYWPNKVATEKPVLLIGKISSMSSQYRLLKIKECVFQ